MDRTPGRPSTADTRPSGPTAEVGDGRRGRRAASARTNVPTPDPTVGAGHRHRGRCLRVRGGCPGWSREAGGAGVWLARRRGGRCSPPRPGARRRWRPSGAIREIGWFMDRAWESEYTSPGVGAGCRHAGIMQPKCPVGEPRPEYGESRCTLAPVRLSLTRWASGRLLRARSAPTCGDHRHRASAVGRRRRSARSRGRLDRLRSRKPGGADTGPGPRFRTRPERRAVKPAHLPRGKASTLRLRSICRVSDGPCLTRRIRVPCRLRERARAHRHEPCRRTPPTICGPHDPTRSRGPGRSFPGARVCSPWRTAGGLVGPALPDPPWRTLVGSARASSPPRFPNPEAVPPAPNRIVPPFPGTTALDLRPLHRARS